MKNIVEFSQKLETFIEKNELNHVAELFKSEYAIERSEELEKTLLELENQDRTLRIGIIGRVKAGKSSLLNALIFDGKNILPKAATPMTAALTILEYGENPEAEIDFYSQSDIENIKKEHDSYVSSRDKKIQEAIEKEKSKLLKNPLNKKSDEELREKAEKNVNREMKDHPFTSSYQQYEKIRSSRVNLSELEQNKKITASDSKELNEKLKEYVGSDGKYMPFTKSVTLKLNEKKLQELQIVDTPGINDPVKSREERTHQYLKNCDVVLIVSPAHQF